MRPTVLLFDIDGTLISSAGAGTRAVARAFEAHTGRRDACAHFSFAGMTDRAIVRAGLTAVGRPTDEGAIDAVIEVYLGFLVEEVAASTRYRTHVGVEAVLAAAAARPRCAVGLGTGNVAAGARIKLSRSGFAERFAFGGFGSDAEDRAALLRVGAERGAARLGARPEDCRVVVIGDTPRDVEAGHAIGAEVIAVATGPIALDVLRALAPAAVFADLAEDGALETIVSGG